MAEPLYRQEQDDLGLANLLRSRGDLLSRLGDVEGAKEAYDMAEPLYRQEKSNLGLANLLRSRGDLLSRLGDVEGAKEAYDMAEPLYHQEKNNLGLANLLQSRGDLLMDCKMPNQAYVYYKDALNLYQDIQASVGEIYALAELYGCCVILKKTAEAEKMKEHISGMIDSIPYSDVKNYVQLKIK